MNCDTCKHDTQEEKCGAGKSRIIIRPDGQFLLIKAARCSKYEAK